jgi:hypothetical protein
VTQRKRLLFGRFTALRDEPEHHSQLGVNDDQSDPVEREPPQGVIVDKGVVSQEHKAVDR